ncbi:MAG: DUF4012 domain-containing protein [Patescibacteria group bacterium]
MQRAEKMRTNLLRIEKVGAKRNLALTNRQFEFSRKSPDNSKNSLYLPAEKARRGNFGRLKIVAAALVLVFALNLLGIFGTGKKTVERTVATAFSGIGDLIAASESFAAGDFTTSENRFAEAVEVLRGAEKDLMVLSGAGAILETQPDNVQAGSRLVSAGKLLASGGEKFANAANQISVAFSNWQIRQSAFSNGEKVESFAKQLDQPITEILGGVSELENAAALLDLVETKVLPAELTAKVDSAKNELHYFLELAGPLTNALPALPDLLGGKVPRRYLILFQNPDEIRAAGGFVGSVGILDLDDGFVKKFEIKDVYEIDGQLKKHFDPPEGFEFITGSWGLRDSNFSPDFPTSAAAAEKLFEAAGFGSVDGVAAVNASFLETLVAQFGGIKLDRFKRAIAPDELTLLLSLIIEAKVDGATSPKNILNDVWAAVENKLGELKPSELATLAWRAINAKEIQFASSNPDFENFAVATHLANELAPTDGDYLFVVNTSLSGNKSDRFTGNEIAHTTEIAANGEAVDTVKIVRKHDWNDAAEQQIEQLASEFKIRLTDNLKEILGRGRNIDLVKVFVPAGAELISVEGIAADSISTHAANGKTYFMFSLTTQPKFSREVILKYRLPQKFEKNYSFLGEFQSGDETREIMKTVDFGDEKIFDGELELGAEKNWTF